MPDSSQLLGQAFSDALEAGLNAAKPVSGPGKKFIEDFLRSRSKAFARYARQLAAGDIDEGTAEYFMKQEKDLAEASALAVAGLTKVAIQAAVDAFMNSLVSSIKSILKISL